MPKVKIAIIGGGSYGWTFTIVRDLVVTPELEGSTIVLEDIDADAFKITGPLCRKVVRKSGRKFTIETTTSEAAALKGADYVILTISTGGFDTMEHDIGVPLKYGIYQSVGDTVGPGGISRALRNIPVVVDIGRHMEKLCPAAWMLNYSNPLTTLSRALTRETSRRYHRTLPRTSMSSPPASTTASGSSRSPSRKRVRTRSRSSGNT